MTSDPTDDSPYRLDGIITFLPLFESPGFEFGHWETPESNEPNVLIAPYFSFSDTGRMFAQAVYDSGWVVADFDWQRRVDTAEANRLREDRSALEIGSARKASNYTCQGRSVFRGHAFGGMQIALAYWHFAPMPIDTDGDVGVTKQTPHGQPILTDRAFADYSARIKDRSAICILFSGVL
jgi:hypothetical protein